jgi:single-stranded-DNA-specific exonuclease
LIIEKIARQRGGGDDYLKDFSNPKPPMPEVSLGEIPVWKKAAARIAAAVSGQQKVIIFGDYDCDGICSVALVMDYLESAGLATKNMLPFLPNRFDDSYGLTQEALEKVLRRQKQTALLIAVDCGSPSFEALKFLRKKSIETIVLDHHPVEAMGKDHPADFHLNPKGWPELAAKRKDLCELCAAGLVYLFCDAMARHFKNPKWNSDRGMILAALATCADVVPIFRLNRALVKNAIWHYRFLADRPKIVPGLWSLHQHINARFHEKFNFYPVVDENTFGLSWGPCINASGRLDDARPSLELLRATSIETATQLAGECVTMNRRRCGIQRRVLEQARKQAIAQVGNLPPAKVILCAGQTWNIGVVGIVAARLREEFCRPAIVCGRDGDGKWRGSGRSIPGFDMGKWFKVAATEDKNKPNAKLLLSGGGHELAGGLSMTDRQRPSFHKWSNEICQLTAEEDFIRKQEIIGDAVIFSPKSWKVLLDGLLPFGKDHPSIPIIMQHAWLDYFTVKVYKPRDPNWENPDAGPPAAITNDEKLETAISEPPVESAEDETSENTIPEPPKPLPFARGNFRLPGRVWPICVRWKDIDRVRREWRMHRRYTLALEVRINRRGEHYFSVLDCWPEGTDTFPPPYNAQNNEAESLATIKDLGLWPEDSSR